MFKLFRAHERPNGSDIEYLPGAAATVYAPGEALTLTAGALAKVTGADAPEFVCAGLINAGVVPVYRVRPGMEFITTFDGDAAEVKEGDKVTIGDDSLTVTPTVGGAAIVLRKLGGEVIVSFALGGTTTIQKAGVQTITQGDGVTVDNTDPANPTVSATAKVVEVVAGTGVAVDNKDPAKPVVSATPAAEGGT